MAITGINNNSYTSYYASGYKNTVKKAACDIQKTKENLEKGEYKKIKSKVTYNIRIFVIETIRVTILYPTTYQTYYRRKSK